MTDTSRILIEIDADGTVAEKGLRQTGQAVRKFSKDAQADMRQLAGVYQDAEGRWRESNGRFVNSARQAELGLKKVGQESQRTARSYDLVSRSGKGLSKMWGEQARTLGQLERAGIRTGAVMGGLAVGGFAAAVKEGLDFNATMESNKIGLEQFLGSGKKVDKFLGDLFQTARKTPFEFKDITDAAKKFLAFGFTVDETKKSLQAIGDATAALGGGADKIDRLVIAFGQIQAKGRVQGDELLQLAEAGIPAYQILQEKLGLTAKEVKNIGNVGIQSQDAINALIDGMNDRFHGATEKQAKSWKGMWSTIHDDTDQALGAMTKSLFDELEKHWLPAFDKTAQGITKVWDRKDLTPEEKFRKSWAIIEKDIGPLVDKVGDAIAKADIPAKLGNAVQDAAPKVADAAGKLAVVAAKEFIHAFGAADPVGKGLLAALALGTAKKVGVLDFISGVAKGGKGAKGLAGALGKDRGATPANPLFVAVINDLPGKGGGSLLDDILQKGKKVGPAGIGLTGAAVAGATVGTAGAIYAATGNGVPTLKGGKDIIDNINGSTESAREKVRRLDDAISHLNDSFGGAGQRSKLDPAYGKALQDLEGYKGKLADAADQEDHYVAQMNRAIGKLRDSHGRSLQDIAETTDRRARSIRETLSTNSEIGRETLASNFSAAATAIKTQMDAGAVSVETGTEKINKYLTDAMKALGFDKTQIKHYMSSSTGDVSGKGSAGKSGSGQGAAKGMLHRLPGNIGPDSIPMNVNGRQIVAAPGEDVAILTQHQRKFLDERTADVGGLSGVFSAVNAAHNQASYAKGGMVTGDTDYKPAVGKALERMARDTHTPIFVQSGGRSRAEQIALASTRSPTHPVAGPNGPHVQGIAADITPGREKFGQVAGKYGLGFTVPQESWHVQLIDSAVASGQISAAEGAQIKRAVYDGPGGMVGALGQGSLDGYRGAAQALLDKLSGGAGDGTSPVMPSGKTGGSAAAKAYAQQRLSSYGWDATQWSPLDKLWTGESGWNPNAVNPSSGAAGIPQALGHGHVFDLGDYVAQVTWGLNYIKDTYGSPAAAYSQWLSRSPHWYAHGGLVGFDQGGDPSYKDWRSRATGTGTGKKKKKAKAKKQPKPFTSGPAMPDLSKIKGKKTRPGQGKWKSSHTNYDLPEGWDGIDPGVIPDFDALFDGPAETISNQIEQLSGRFGLSDEEPVVSLTDTGSFKDLTAFWAAHPDLAKDYKDQVDTFDVVNWDGMTVQGKPVRGIHQHTSELEQLLALHSGSTDGTGTNGLLGLLMSEIGSKSDTSKKVGVRRDLSVFAMTQIRRSWEAEADRREHAIGKVRKLNAGGQTWEQRVSDNDARVKALRDWKRKVSAESVGHRKTEALQKQETKADQEIADLQDENQTLKDTHPAPKKAIPHGASPHERARIQAANAQRTGQLRHWTAVRDDAARELDYLDGSRERWQTTDGVAKGWQDRIDAHNTALKDLATDIKQLNEQAVPAEQLAIAQLAQERGDWLGTTVSLPALQASTNAADDSGRNDLIKQQLTEETTKRIVAESQFAVFSGFAPLVSGRSLGSFAKGTMQPIPETGPAILHKGETVVPDPQGAFGLDQRITSGTTAPVINVYLQGDAAPLMSRVRAEVDGRAAKVVSEQLGKRQRMLTISPGN